MFPEETYWPNPLGPEIERFPGVGHPTVSDAWEEQHWNAFLSQVMGNMGAPERGGHFGVFPFNALACELLTHTEKHPILSTMIDQDPNKF